MTSVRLDDRAQLVVPHRQASQLVRIGQDLRIGELLFESVVLVDDVGEAVEHGESRLLVDRVRPQLLTPRRAERVRRTTSATGNAAPCTWSSW